MNRPSSYLVLAGLSLTLLLAGCASPSVEELMLQSMQKSVAGDNAGALADITDAIEMRATDANLYVVRAGIHESRGDIASTVADYEKALSLNPALEPGLKQQLDHLRE